MLREKEAGGVNADDVDAMSVKSRILTDVKRMIDDIDIEMAGITKYVGGD